MSEMERDVVAVLDAHRLEDRPDYGVIECECGEWRGPETWEEHVAEALAPLIAERERVARAEALREAARDWQVSLWPFGATTWLRRRAARLDAPQPADAPEGHGDADEAGEGA